MSVCPDTANSERVSLVLEVLDQSGSLHLRLRGQSMLPSIWPGDEVEIVRCSAGDLKSGDVAVAVRDSRIFMHRVLGFSPQGEVITRGDAMPQADAPFQAASIAGKVVRITRRTRSFSPGSRQLFVRRGLGLLFCYSDLVRRIALRLHAQKSKTLSAPELQFQSACESVNEGLR